VNFQLGFAMTLFIDPGAKTERGYRDALLSAFEPFSRTRTTGHTPAYLRWTFFFPDNQSPCGADLFFLSACRCGLT
jgi:hypothetical protein